MFLTRSDIDGIMFDEEGVSCGCHDDIIWEIES